jgi:hypothetical protein
MRFCSGEKIRLNSEYSMGKWRFVPREHWVGGEVNGNLRNKGVG